MMKICRLYYNTYVHYSTELIEEFPKSTIKSLYTSPSLVSQKHAAHDTVVILSSDSEDEDQARRNNQKTKSNGM